MGVLIVLLLVDMVAVAVELVVTEHPQEHLVAVLVLKMH